MASLIYITGSDAVCVSRSTRGHRQRIAPLTGPLRPIAAKPLKPQLNR